MHPSCFFNSAGLMMPLNVATIFPSRPMITVPGRAEPRPNRCMSSALAPSHTGKFSFASLYELQHLLFVLCRISRRADDLHP